MTANAPLKFVIGVNIPIHRESPTYLKFARNNSSDEETEQKTTQAAWS